MVYFIIGCNGLVGSYIAREILKNGGKVKALKREESDMSMVKDIASQIEWIPGDLLDIVSLEEGIVNADYVIHAAGMVSFNPNDAKKLFKINVEGTANVVNSCLRYPVKKLLFISSVAAIGKNSREEIIEEGNKWENDKVVTTYSLTKYLAEQEVWRAIEEGLDAVIVNPSIIFGVGNWKKSSLKLIDYLWNAPNYFPVGLANYVDVRDVAEISFKLLISDIKNERFILNSGSTLYKDLFEKISVLLDKTPPQKVLKPWFGIFISYIDWFFSSIFRRKQKITKEMIISSSDRVKYSNRKISNTLGINFKDINETLEWVCKHYVNFRLKKEF